jgi:exopolysaccharide biosynthesis predicted pyruvyltransferase EpsI
MPSPSEQPSTAIAQLLKSQLHQALEQIPPYPQCALLDYPNYPNLGDHLIWLGSLWYLRMVAQSQITYTAGQTNFSGAELEHQLPEGPIFLLGGGNFGDLWPAHQAFREAIIARYPERPIVILPQTVFFRHEHSLEQARRVMNQHPNLTLFTRDRISYDLACQAFDNCRVLMAPDAALQLTDLASFPIPGPRHGLLYHCRKDIELQTQAAVGDWGFSSVDISDWPSYENHWLYDSHWLLRPDQGIPEVLKKWLQVRTLGHLFRAVWQRRLSRPREWASLHQWDAHFRPETLFTQVHQPDRQRQTWSFIHAAIYQFRQYEVVVTNRLHGHILCTLLDIPHVFLPNSYYKNQAFYEMWTANSGNSVFVEDARQIPAAIAQLTTPSN